MAEPRVDGHYLERDITGLGPLGPYDPVDRPQ